MENTGSIKKRTNLTAAKKSPLSTSGADVSKSDTIAALKLKLLSVVSGLNKGLAASEDDLRRADAAAKELENAGGPVDLITEFDKLQGIWKLVYRSTLSGRTLGGSRPGPPTGRLLPITLVQFGCCKPVDECNFEYGSNLDQKPTSSETSYSHRDRGLG